MSDGCLFKDGFPLMGFWMWSFPGFIWRSRSLCLVLGLSARWSSTRGWVMFSLQGHDHRNVAVQIPTSLLNEGVSPLPCPRSSSSVSRGATSAYDQEDLRIMVRASPSSASSRASHSCSTSHHLVFPDEFGGWYDMGIPGQGGAQHLIRCASGWQDVNRCIGG